MEWMRRKESMQEPMPITSRLHQQFWSGYVDEKKLKNATVGINGKLIIKEYPTATANANHFRILSRGIAFEEAFCSRYHNSRLSQHLHR